MLSGEATPAQIAALAIALRAKGETVEEMTGFVRAMVAHAVPLDLPAGIEVVDTCGTGGDRLRSINVSTIAALVVAATGAKVCKHGGRASSSAVGAADVLEALGVVADLGPGRGGPVHRRGRAWGSASPPASTRPCGSPARCARSSGIPTVFNFLGPLANPGRARYQVIGVSDPAMADKMLGVLAANGTRRAMVVYGDDGLDELSTTGPSTVHELIGDGRRASTRRRCTGSTRPTLGLGPGHPRGPAGRGRRRSTPRPSARWSAGEPSPHRDIAVLNAAAALVVIGRAADLAAGVALACEVIDDGRADPVLEALVRVSQEASAEAEPADTASTGRRLRRRAGRPCPACRPVAQLDQRRDPLGRHGQPPRSTSTSKTRTCSALAREPLGDDVPLVVVRRRRLPMPTVSDPTPVPCRRARRGSTNSPPSSSTVPSPSTASTNRPAPRSDSTRRCRTSRTAEPLGLVADRRGLLVALLRGQFADRSAIGRRELGRVARQLVGGSTCPPTAPVPGRRAVEARPGSVPRVPGPGSSACFPLLVERRRPRPDQPAFDHRGARAAPGRPGGGRRGAGGAAGPPWAVGRR